MQAITPLAAADFLDPVQRVLYKLEVYNGSAWVNISPYLMSVGASVAGPGLTPEVVAGTWSAEVSNEDGRFHPFNPSSVNAGLFTIGREVRISVGGVFGGVEYYWTRLIGYMDEPDYDDGAMTVSLSGCDYSKRLADTFLYSPYTYWGSSQTYSTTATPGTLGSEIYAEADALDQTNDADNVDSWTPFNATFESSGDGGGGSTYLAVLTREAEPGQAYAANSNVGAVVSGDGYSVSFKAQRTAGDGTLALVVYQSNGTSIMGFSTEADNDSWATYTFDFTASASTNAYLRFNISGSEGTAFKIDQVSLKKIETAPGVNAVYQLPTAATGVHYATLDGAPVWQGDPAEKMGWLALDGTGVFEFVDGAVVASGTNNLVIYFYEAQTVENVVAGLLVGAGLYASTGAALAAMDYVATGVTVNRVWFESDSSALNAIAKLCERVNYRFWFGCDGTPYFRPTPAAGSLDFSFDAFGRLRSLGNRQDREQLANRVVVEGAEQSAYKTRNDKNESRLVATASDSTSITTYGEHTENIKNHLFQTQSSMDAMAATLLAERKAPRWFSRLATSYMVAPLEVGDTVMWPVKLSASKTIVMAGLVTALELQNSDLTLVVMVGAPTVGALDVAASLAAPFVLINSARPVPSPIALAASLPTPTISAVMNLTVTPTPITARSSQLTPIAFVDEGA